MPWKYKMQKKIDTLRKELSLLAIKDPPTKHTAIKRRRIHRKYKLKESQVKDRVAEHQAEIKGLAATIRNRENKDKSRTINSQFSTNPRRVYNELINEKVEVKKPPDKESLENFWRPLYETEKIHEEHEWIEEIQIQNEPKPTMPTLFITAETVKRKDYTIWQL